MTAASAFAVLLGATIAACSGDDSTPANTGGSPGTGGNATGGGAGTGGGTAGTGGGGTGGTVSDSGSEACTCTAANCTPAGVLFAFDGVDGGVAGTWDIYPAPAADGGGLQPVQSSSTTEGHTANGSLQLTVPYTDFGQGAISIQHNFGSAPPNAVNWSCKSAVHFWVKVAPSADGGSVTSFINGIQAYIQSGDPDADAANMGGYSRYTPTFVVGSTFADGAFHEIVVPFTPAQGMSVNPIDVNQIGVQVLPIASPDAGTGTPATVTLFIDDISLI